MDAELLSDVSVGAPFGEFAADGSNISVGQLGKGVSLSRLRATRLSVLGVHISDVVCLRAKEEMSRIAARRVVAAMQNENVGRHYGAVVQFVSDAMRSEPLPVWRVSRGDDPVSMGVSMSGPWPAFSTLADGDLLPEPVFDGCDGAHHAVDIAWGLDLCQ